MEAVGAARATEAVEVRETVYRVVDWEVESVGVVRTGTATRAAEAEAVESVHD